MQTLYSIYSRGYKHMSYVVTALQRFHYPQVNRSDNAMPYRRYTYFYRSAHHQIRYSYVCL